MIIALFLLMVPFCLFYFYPPPPPKKKKFEVATSLKHLLKGEWVPVINKKFDSAPTKQGLIDLNWKHDYLLLIKSLSNKLRNWKTSPA